MRVFQKQTGQLQGSDQTRNYWHVLNYIVSIALLGILALFFFPKNPFGVRLQPLQAVFLFVAAAISLWAGLSGHKEVSRKLNVFLLVVFILGMVVLALYGFIYLGYANYNLH